MHAAAKVMGLDRVVFLGYRDSGMNGEPTNDDPECFWQADVEEAAERLAAILREESAGMITIYDEIGGYHHPDHVQVHRVGRRAAELAGTPIVFESTMNREQMASFADDPSFADMDMSEEEREVARDEFRGQDFGMPAAQITHAVDATPWIARKRAAMAAHHSQIDEDTFFLMLPEDAFVAAFGTEWFIRHGVTRAGEPYETDIYADL
jgi:LmbE family N-acetylglucosaminyl deacetylase